MMRELFGSSESYQFKNFIPQSQVENLDVIASLNEQFEGCNCSQKMLTMSYDEYIDYKGPLNLYLAQIPLYKRINKNEIEIIDRSKQDTEIIIKELNNQNRSTSIMKFPRFIDKQIDSINLWESRGFTDSGWHYDSYENYLILIEGLKIVWVAHPSQRSGWDRWQPIQNDAYNHLKEGGNMNYKPHRTQFIILHENEALYIPRGWLHRVQSFNNSKAINIWFGNVDSNGSAKIYQFRHIINKILSDQIRSEIKTIIEKQIDQLQINKKLKYYQRIVQNRNFDILQGANRYRTKKRYSYLKEQQVLTLLLYQFSSYHTIEYLQYLIDEFGDKAELILQSLNPINQVILAQKLNDFSTKDQFIVPEDKKNWYLTFVQQKQNKILFRDQVFEQLWKKFSPKILDLIQQQNECFKKQVLDKLIEDHT